VADSAVGKRQPSSLQQQSNSMHKSSRTVRLYNATGSTAITFSGIRVKIEL
jgi:hypothetical protein